MTKTVDKLNKATSSKPNGSGPSMSSDEIARILRMMAVQGKTGLLDCRYERVELQGRIVNAINGSLNAEDEESWERRRAEAEELLSEFHEQDGAGHSTPEWIRPTMDFVFNNLLTGNLDLAEEKGLVALDAAKKDWQKGISCANLALLYRKTGKLDKAVRFALRAVKLDPRNGGFWSDLVLVSLDADRRDIAQEILRQVPEMANLEDPTDSWRLHLLKFAADYERHLDVPELARLYEQINSSTDATDFDRM